MRGNDANLPRIEGDAKCKGSKASHWVGLGEQGQMNFQKGSSGRFNAYPLL